MKYEPNSCHEERGKFINAILKIHEVKGFVAIRMKDYERIRKLNPYSAEYTVFSFNNESIEKFSEKFKKMQSVYDKLDSIENELLDYLREG